MLDSNITKEEVEKQIQGKGDFVQIDYLTKLLDEKPPILLKQYIYLKLSKIYESKKMFVDSGKMLENLAVISTSFSKKTDYFLKAAENYIKDGFFEKADNVAKKALEGANVYERGEIFFSIKNFYKEEAKNYEKELKRNHAAKIYEKLLSMNISEVEKKEIKKKLLELYEKLGKFKEYGILERGE